eukprot:518905-Prymnesium_polylepis.1
MLQSGVSTCSVPLRATMRSPTAAAGRSSASASEIREACCCGALSRATRAPTVWTLQTFPRWPTVPTQMQSAPHGPAASRVPRSSPRSVQRRAARVNGRRACGSPAV